MAKSKYPKWEPFQEAQSVAYQDVRAAKLAVKLGRTSARVFINNLYQVSLVDEVNPFTGVVITHLSIKRVDKTATHDWRDLQRIKNELCGPEREAVEVYPAESRLVDTSDQYHLWVYPEGYTVPMGFMERMVSEHPMEGGSQRPFPVANKPKDLMSREQLDARIREVLARPTEEPPTEVDSGQEPPKDP